MFMYGLSILSMGYQKFVVGIGGMGIYNKINISNIEKKHNENVWLDWELNLGHLQMFCPLRNTHQKQVHPVGTY